MTAVLPPARVAIAGNAPPSREWYRYFQASTQVNLDVGTLRHDVDALTVRVTALEETTPSSGDIKITGTGSIYVSATAVKVVGLEGDAEDPGFTTYYGTDSTGAKGWYAVSDALASSGNIAKSTDAAGVTSFDLVDLADSGTGTALVKITRDAKGRMSGTSAATTTDLAEGTNLYFTDARADARITLQKAQPLGLATLDAGGKLDPGQLPALAITETFVVNTEAAMLALSAQEGDVAVRTDLSKSFILTADPPSTLANWQELLTPTGAVTSFNGRTGSVVPASGDYTPAQVGLGNVDNTSDTNKPVSTLQAAADALNVPLDGSRAMRGTLSIQTATSLQVSMGVAHSTIATGPIQSGALDGNLVNESISCSNTVAFGCRHNFYRGRGTIASPNDVMIADTIGALQFNARIGGAWQNAAAVYAEVDGTPGASFAPARLYFQTSDGLSAIVVRWNVRAAGHFEPFADNVYNIGSASNRAKVVYAATGAINTSDAREKTEVAPLTADEMAAAADLARAPGTYQWLQSVQLKGADARHHVGLTVQQAIAIMQAHGLDPMRYGFICYDQWPETPEVVDSETGEVTQAYCAAGDRYSFRNDEMLMFIARGFAARLDALETAR